MNNNLPKELKKALLKLKNLTEERKVVFCKSDKDGKIIIMSYQDYIKVITKELQKYQVIETTNINDMIKDIKGKAESMIITLYKEDTISKELLYAATGITITEMGHTRRITRIKAKYFANSETGYVYPLLKTHKLEPSEIERCPIDQIPVRLVQSAGHTFLTRITTMLNEILSPISVDYCKTQVNEFCRDSFHYIKELCKWKEGGDEVIKSCYIVAADVKALYPNLERKWVEMALGDALNQCTEFTHIGKITLVKLVMHCLSNVLLEFDEKIYAQEKGIVTGENNSVAIANITLHFMIKQIPEINQLAFIFKRYIDDMIYITRDETGGNIIKTQLIRIFKDHNLELTFREIDTRDRNVQVEFLDVLHMTDKCSNGGFRFKNFVKPTAANALFLNGKSYHPLHVFRGIILGEARRLRRINEYDEDYLMGLEGLKIKCNRSGFPINLTSRNIEVVKTWKRGTDVALSGGKVEKAQYIIPWSSEFSCILNQNRKEKILVPNSVITYCRPPTLSSFLLNYRKIAHNNKKKKDPMLSTKCGRCGLCGNFGKLQNMVMTAKKITYKEGKTILLSNNLNCKSFGIYAGQCKKCNDIYVGQTKNSFNTRWNQHRSIWNKMQKQRGNEIEIGELKDEAALFVHYIKKHSDCLHGLKLSEAYNVFFLEQPTFEFLDISETFWINKLRAKINIMNTFDAIVKF